MKFSLALVFAAAVVGLFAPTPAKALALTETLTKHITSVRGAIDDALEQLTAADPLALGPPRDIPSVPLIDSPADLLADALDTLDLDFFTEEDVNPLGGIPRKAQVLVGDLDTFVAGVEGHDGAILRSMMQFKTASPSEIDALGAEVMRGFEQVDAEMKALEADVVRVANDETTDLTLAELEERAETAVGKVGKVAAMMAIRENLKKASAAAAAEQVEESFHEQAVDAGIDHVEEEIAVDIENLDIAEKLAEETVSEKNEAKPIEEEKDGEEVKTEEEGKPTKEIKPVEEEEEEEGLKTVDEVEENHVGEEEELTPSEDRSLVLEEEERDGQGFLDGVFDFFDFSDDDDE